MSAAETALANSDLKIALVQLTSNENVEHNLEQIEKALLEIEKHGDCDLVCLPENALFLRIGKNTTIPSFELDDPIFSMLQASVNRGGYVLHIGSVPLQEKTGKPSNASIWLVPDEQPEAVYRKIHLFDVDVQGNAAIRESDHFQSGRQPKILHLKSFKIGLSICYDIRFSDLFLYYAREEVDVLLVPSAFLVATGQAHWEILLRARAIESQAFVLAAAQGGEHVSGEEKRYTYGHSLAVDPWGEILAECKENASQDSSPKVVYASLKESLLEKVRSQIPMTRHRKRDLLES